MCELCNDAVPFNELLDHVKEKHYSHRRIVDSNGIVVDSNGIMCENLIIKADGFEMSDPSFPHSHYNYSGHTFFPRIVKRGEIYYVYLKILCDEGAAKEFLVDLEVANVEDKAIIILPGMKVYSVDIKWQDVIEDGEGVLKFDHTMARKLIALWIDHWMTDDVTYQVNTKYKIKKI